MPIYTTEVAREFTDRIDALRKRNFLAAGQRGELKVEQFVPATGIGKFDAVYDPQTHRLDVTLRVRFWFQDRVGKAATESEIAWIPQEKLDFVRDAKKVIEEAWSERYTFACAKPGWIDQYADVHIKVQECRHGQEDYLVKVIKLARFKSSGGIDHGQIPHVCGVNNYANDLDSSKKTDQIFNFKEGIFRAKLRESVPDQSGDFVEFGANSTTLSSDNVLRLNRWSQFITQNRTDDLKGIRAYVVGLTGKKDSVFSRGLAKGRAAAVAELLNSRVLGGDFAETASADEPWAKEALSLVKRRARNHVTGFGGALVVLRTPTGASRDVPMKYIVMVHEAGHMLGLPDEYMGVQHHATLSKMQLDAVIPSTFMASQVAKGNDRTAKMQGNMTDEVSRANVVMPYYMGTQGEGDRERSQAFQTDQKNWYDRRDAARKKLGTGDSYDAWKQRNPEPTPPANLATISSSVMHSGDEILPAHYVTLWSALCYISAGYIDPDEWKIVPSNKGPSTMRYFK